VLSIRREFTLSATLPGASVVQGRASNSENVQRGPGLRKRVGGRHRQAGWQAECQKERRFPRAGTGHSGLSGLSVLAFSVSTFRHAHTREFGIVTLIKLARVTSRVTSLAMISNHGVVYHVWLNRTPLLVQLSLSACEHLRCGL